MSAEERSLEEFQDGTSTGNRLLDALPGEDRARIVAKAEHVAMPLGEIAFQQGEEIQYVHFPTRGVLSLVTTTQEGSTIEVSTLGNEGTTGVPVFLGAGSMANVRCMAQVDGEALRVDANFFREVSERRQNIRKMMNSYTQALLTQVGQAVACSRLHSTPQRCARWLLMTNDRAGQDEFVLTQEFLAYMLGVRRASVTDAVGPLRKRGLISYSRGHLKILNREGLEAIACECYEIMRSAFDDVFETTERA